MANKHSVKDDGDPRKYYAAIPNLVFRIGLNSYEIALYVYLKQVAGEDGACWKSTATIAKDLRAGTGTISRTKIALALPRAELGGKALISITTEMQNGGNPNHSIAITDIWPENMAELGRARVGKVTRSTVEGDAFHTSATRSSGEGARSTLEGTRSPVEPKNNPLIKTHEEDKSGGFLSKLKTDPLYSHVDFDYQLELMRRWLVRPEHKGRRMTERFVLNWIGKIDRPVDVSPSGNGSVPKQDRAAWEAEQRRKYGWDKLEQRTA